MIFLVLNRGVGTHRGENDLRVLSALEEPQGFVGGYPAQYHIFVDCEFDYRHRTVIERRKDAVAWFVELPAPSIESAPERVETHQLTELVAREVFVQFAHRQISPVPERICD